MNWPGWSDVFPSLTLVGGTAGLLWTLVRLMVHPVVAKAALEAEKRATAAATAAVDGLYDKLKESEFAGLDKRIDDLQKDIGGRLDRMEGRAQQERTATEGRLTAAIQGGVGFGQLGTSPIQIPGTITRPEGTRGEGGGEG